MVPHKQYKGNRTDKDTVFSRRFRKKSTTREERKRGDNTKKRGFLRDDH